MTDKHIDPKRASDVAPSAKAVAKHLDRRQVRRKVVLYGALVGAIVFAIVYGTCGKGWGIGGKGKGDGDGSGKALVSSTADAGPRRVEVVVAADGISVDGVMSTRQQAIAACKAAAGVDVIVTGGARQGDWDDLKAALEAENIDYKRDPQGGPVDTNATPPDAGTPAPAGSGSAGSGSGTTGSIPRKPDRAARRAPAEKPILWDGLDCMTAGC